MKKIFWFTFFLITILGGLAINHFAKEFIEIPPYMELERNNNVQ